VLSEQPRKRSKARTEARWDVRTLVAAEKFHHLSSKASELFSHIENENLPVAVFLARDLRFEIDGAIARWQFLDAATRNDFERPAVSPCK